MAWGLVRAKAGKQRHLLYLRVCIDVHGSTYEPDGKKPWKRKEGKWLNLGIWKTHFPLLYHLSPPFKQAVTLLSSIPLTARAHGKLVQLPLQDLQLLSSK